MIIEKYILTTLRLMLAKWWLSLIKIFSLSSGILSFLLIWLFYLDQQFLFGEKSQLSVSCTAENLFLLGGILFITTVIYFLVMKSQMSFRQKELFFRKLYGESNMGIIIILMIETCIFILIAFVFSLVLIDQITPYFNEITNKNVNFKDTAKFTDFIMITLLLFLFEIVVGILPSFWYSRNRAVDILKKIR